MGHVRAGILAQERHEAETSAWLHERIRNWYRDRAAERELAGIRGMSLKRVLSCHEAGEMAWEDARQRAVSQDQPGYSITEYSITESEEED